MLADHIHKMKAGWLVPYLVAHTCTTHQRWTYWIAACSQFKLPAGPIPQISFAQHPHLEDAEHIQDILDIYVREGVWYDEAWLAFVRWLLHGCGREGLQEDVERIPRYVQNAWYEQFDIGRLLHSPIDWSAYVLQGGLPAMKTRRSRWADSTGFFSTPMNVIHVMEEMVFMGMPNEETKLMTVCDPACGTGSQLLAASNRSLRLYGIDIQPDLCLCAELNGWLWAPWLAFTPGYMIRLFEAQSGTIAPQKVPIKLETAPTRVEATQSYRAGQLTQADFFAAMGLHNASAGL